MLLKNGPDTCHLHQSNLCCLLTEVSKDFVFVNTNEKIESYLQQLCNDFHLLS